MVILIVVVILDQTDLLILVQLMGNVIFMGLLVISWESVFLIE